MNWMLDEIPWKGNLSSSQHVIKLGKYDPEIVSDIKQATEHFSSRPMHEQVWAIAGGSQDTNVLIQAERVCPI